MRVTHELHYESDVELGSLFAISHLKKIFFQYFLTFHIPGTTPQFLRIQFCNEFQ